MILGDIPQVEEIYGGKQHWISDYFRGQICVPFDGDLCIQGQKGDNFHIIAKPSQFQ